MISSPLALSRRGDNAQDEAINRSPYRSEAASQPRPCRLRLLLERIDLVLLDHRQADVVEAVEQAVLAVGIDVELHHATVGAANLLLLQVDRQRRVGTALGVVEQLLQI